MELMKRSDVAKMFGKRSRTIINWEKKGILKPIKICGQVYYDGAEVSGLAKKEGD